MPPPFQPNSREPHEIATLQRLLTRHASADSIDGHLTQIVAQAATFALGRACPGLTANTQSLGRRLIASLLHVQDANGVRTLVVVGAHCWRLAVDDHGQAQDFWQPPAGTPTRPLHEALTTAEWCVALAPLLSRVVTGWLQAQPFWAGLYPDEQSELPAYLTKALRRPLERAGPALKALLLLHMGYPADFLSIYLRELSRGQSHPSLEEMRELLVAWPTLRRWPWRARKLAWLGLALKSLGLVRSLQLEEVRRTLRSQGLSRNAWARLHRVPLLQIRDTAFTLETWGRELPLTPWLESLSFLLSRLGPQARMYRAYRSNLPEVICDMPGRLAQVRTGCTPPAPDERQQKFRANHRACALHFLNRVVQPRREDAHHVEKTGLFLSAIARHLLRHRGTGHPDTDNRSAGICILGRLNTHHLNTGNLDVIAELTDLGDWFSARAAALPVHAFRGEVPALLLQSRQWHEREHADLRQRLEARTRELGLQENAGLDIPAFLRRKDAPLATDAPWPLPLRHFEWHCLEFLVLEQQEELLQEALAMQHCVNSYGGACRSGTCHIASLRSEGERIGTLELRRGYDGRWSMVQLKGRKNARLGDATKIRGLRLQDGIRDFLKAFNQAAQQPGGANRQSSASGFTAGPRPVG